MSEQPIIDPENSDRMSAFFSDLQELVEKHGSPDVIVNVEFDANDPEKTEGRLLVKTQNLGMILNSATSILASVFGIELEKIDQFYKDNIKMFYKDNIEMNQPEPEQEETE